MELVKLQVFEGNTTIDQHGLAITRVCVSIGCDSEHATETSCRKQNRLCLKGVDLPGRELNCDKSPASLTLDDNIQEIVFVKEGHTVFNALLVECLKDHMTGPVRSITGSPDRCLTEVPSMSPEPPLVDEPIRRTAERQALVFKLVDSLDSVFCENNGSILVGEIVSPLDRVKGMPFGFVLFEVP